MVEHRVGGSLAPTGGCKVLDVALATACACLAVIVTGLPLLWEPRFFYIDDYQTYFMPMFHEVARLLGEGEFPLITDRIWRGGALLAEYQVAVLNPVSLALYVAISKISSAPAAAAVYSLFHVAVFAAGTYFMCRALQCRPALAAMAALTAPTSGWLLYWGAINWVPALISMAWMPWAIGLLLHLQHGKQWFVPAALGVAMVLVSGWPFGVLALVILVAVVTLVTLPWQLKGNVGRSLPIYLALITGALVAAPAVLPMLPYLHHNERPFDSSTLWQTSLAALTAVGMPFHRTSWHTFDKFRIVALPMTYVAWFIPVVLANAGIRRMARTPLEGVLLVVTICFGAISMVPMLGHFRWMFRLLPYYHLALIVLTALVLSRRDDTLRFRAIPTALVLLGPFVISVVALPSMARLYFGATTIVLVLVTVSTVFMKAKPRAWIGFALLSNVLIVWAMNYSFVSPGFPVYPNELRSPFSNDEATSSASPKRHLAVFSRLAVDDESDWREFRPGNTSLFGNLISINGYSPFDPKAYRVNFCFDYLGGLNCRDVVNRITRPLDGFGGNILDLTRTEVVEIQSPEIADQFRRAVTGEWQSAVRPSGTTVFSRDMDPAGPDDPISWQPQGVQTRVVDHSPRRIIVDLANDTGAEASLVLARAWYPGWQARLDGVELPVDAVQGFVVRVKVPAGARGHLVVTYWPAALSLGLWMAAVGGMIMIASLVLPRPKRVSTRTADVNLW